MLASSIKADWSKPRYEQWDNTTSSSYSSFANCPSKVLLLRRDLSRLTRCTELACLHRLLQSGTVPSVLVFYDHNIFEEKWSIILQNVPHFRYAWCSPKVRRGLRSFGRNTMKWALSSSQCITQGGWWRCYTSFLVMWSLTTLIWCLPDSSTAKVLFSLRS